MPTEPIRTPRPIAAELIEIGDDILVTHKVEQGVTHTLRGIVGKVQIAGNVRYLTTVEGATILAWTPGRQHVKVMLHGRDPHPKTSLFESDFLDETRERISA